MNERSQILVDSKVSRFLLKLRNQKNRMPFLEESLINKISSMEGTKPSRRIYQSRLNAVKN